MPNKLMMPAPNEKQRMALLERHRYVGYGGARGGGKSWFVRWKAVLLCLQYPGIKVLITRRTYRELYNNHIAPLLLMLGGHGNLSQKRQDFLFPQRQHHLLWLLRRRRGFGAIPGCRIRHLVCRRSRAVPGKLAGAD